MIIKAVHILLFIFLLFPAFAQTHKDELTARVKEYYIIEGNSYPNTQAHVKALEPYIVPTKEGHEYAEYVAQTWENHNRRYSGMHQFSMRTKIVSINAGENVKTGIVITEDVYLYDGQSYSTVTSTSEWVYYKKKWYRSAKRSNQDLH